METLKGVVDKILEAVAKFHGRFLISVGSIILENNLNLPFHVTLKLLKKYYVCVIKFLSNMLLGEF